LIESKNLPMADLFAQFAAVDNMLNERDQRKVTYVTTT
jgi:hypothetical protein